MNRAIVSYYLLWCFVVVVVFNLASGLSANKAVSPESLLAEETSALRDRNAILFFLSVVLGTLRELCRVFYLEGSPTRGTSTRSCG